MIDDCILRIRRNFDTYARGTSEDRCMPKAMTQRMSGVTARSVTRTVGVPQDDLPVSTVHTARRTAGQVQQLAEVKATERSLPRSNARTISVADWWH
jgi:hypothetical protein